MEGQEKITLNIVRNCLLVTIQGDLYESLILKLQKMVLEMVNKKKFRAVIVDLSGIDILDSFLAKAIFDLSRILSLLGFETFYTGFSPELVASLMEIPIEINHIKTAINLDDAFLKIDKIQHER